MKLTKTTEWTVLAVLAAYIAFMPRIGAVRNFLSTGVGRLVALLTIVYVWKYVSALIAVLLVVAFVRCTTSVWEGMESGDEEIQGKAIEGTVCPNKFTFDIAVQMCKDEKGALVSPVQVRCESGYKPNSTNDKCIKIPAPPSPPPPPPLPPPDLTPPSAGSTGSASAEAAAPPNAPEPFMSGRGTVATTPGEAQTLAGGTVVLQQQGGTEPFCGAGPGYPLH